MDLRPGDPAETTVLWKAAMRRTDGPAFLSLTRQTIPALERDGSVEGRGQRCLHPAGGIRGNAPCRLDGVGFRSARGGYRACDS